MDNSNPKINKLEHQESSADGSNLLHENYLKLQKVAKGILSDRYYYLKLKAPGFMDLVIEKIWDNRISLSHYYQQNGDLMADPDMEIIVDHDGEMVKAATFKQDNLGIYQSAYQGDVLVDDKLAKELNDFLGQWLTNIMEQGHIPYSAYYSSEMSLVVGDVSFDKEGNEIVPDTIESDEMEI